MTINYTIKPAEPYKKTIPPSSLYKGRCARCTWMNFWHNFKIPVNMNLQQNLSRKQEKFFDGCPTTTLDATLRPGKITLMKGKKRSSLITINGQQTRWAFYGELDFGVNYDDGGFGVADGKVSLKDDPEDLIDSYTTQLHAYAFMLESPDSGASQKVETLSLIQWKIDSTYPPESAKWGFGVETRYIPIERNDKEFFSFMEKFIGYIEGEFPEADSECYDCKWLNEIGFDYGA